MRRERRGEMSVLGGVTAFGFVGPIRVFKIRALIIKIGMGRGGGGTL